VFLASQAFAWLSWLLWIGSLLISIIDMRQGEGLTGGARVGGRAGGRVGGWVGGAGVCVCVCVCGCVARSAAPAALACCLHTPPAVVLRAAATTVPQVPRGAFEHGAHAVGCPKHVVGLAHAQRATAPCILAACSLRRSACALLRLCCLQVPCGHAWRVRRLSEPVEQGSGSGARADAGMVLAEQRSGRVKWRRCMSQRRPHGGVCAPHSFVCSGSNFSLRACMRVGVVSDGTAASLRCARGWFLGGVGWGGSLSG
jgi:hypothetical protein